MGVIDGQSWLEHLGPAECWSLLASTPVGRIGVLNDSAPEIYPVNHVVPVSGTEVVAEQPRPSPEPPQAEGTASSRDGRGATRR
jgi:Pyridoxamine 5'-phosphate oxidase